MSDDMKRNIIMIGMAGAGKSTVGVVVAKILQKDFVDGDLVIQRRTGRALQDIIDQEGNEAFRRIEEEILTEIEVENAVIAPGGSAIYYPKAMAHFKEGGVVVYLEVPVEEIEARLSNLATRGVTLAEGQTVRDLYFERKPLYEKYADITVHAAGQPLEETARQAAAKVLEYERSRR